VNGIALGVSAIWILVESVSRWTSPPEIRGGFMLVVATGGLCVNIVCGWVLSHGSAGHNANTRAALAHVISDAAGSVAAMIAGALVVTKGWTRADAAASAVVAVLILFGAWSMLRRTVHVLMEGAPAHVSLEEVERTVRDTPGISDLHDLHVWSISDGFCVVTVHVVLDGSSHGTDVAREVSDRVRKAHGIEHVTVQPESPPHPLQPAHTLVRRTGAGAKSG
jgi:cobalt-zinc-cadmium efflux system protein